MKGKEKVVAIIPARGGSKGVPGKNIRDLGGMPLVGYSIRTALASKLIDRVIVSTDCEQVAEISRSLGAEVPFLRPKALAGDTAIVGEAVTFTLNKLREENYFPDYIVDLYPTHPFRSVSLVDFLIGKLFEGFSPVKTVRRITHRQGTIFLRDGDGRLTPMELDEHERHYFRPYALFAGRGNHSECRPYVHVVEDPVALIDIDSMHDFRLAEQAIGNGLFNFKYH